MQVGLPLLALRRVKRSATIARDGRYENRLFDSHSIGRRTRVIAKVRTPTGLRDL
jgi:hypothetical protein